jgi:hypothetical protein
MLNWLTVASIPVSVAAGAEQQSRTPDRTEVEFGELRERVARLEGRLPAPDSGR